jgi:hypothetical protein
MSSIQYDERCVSANWNANEERAQGYNYYIKYKYKNLSYDAKSDKGVAYSAGPVLTDASDPGAVARRIGKTQPACLNIDGTDMKKSKAAEHCAALKPVDWTNGDYTYGQEIGEGNIINQVAAYGENSMITFAEGLEKLFKPPSFNSAKEFFYDLFVTKTYGAISSFVQSIGCTLEQDGCDPQRKSIASFWGRRALDRASLAVPGSKLNDVREDTVDDQTLRMVATGEGTNRSYAEYFIPATAAFGKGEASPACGTRSLK